jgi:HAD-superfamily hydrolase, subfamily IIB
MITIPNNVSYLMNKLNTNGFKAYIVGGCVRDSLRGVTPHDWDITTDALPDDIINCFNEHTLVKAGIKHGTVAVVLDCEMYEITTFRHDGTYTDNRRPDNVEFIKDIKEDLQRRDFTINAIAYNPKEGYIDYFGGTDDIKNGVIKCVGDPDKRFKEDALRIIRAIRFAAVVGYEIDSATETAMYNNKDLLRNIAVERIMAELNKIIASANYCTILNEYAELLPSTKNIIYADEFTVRLALLFDPETLRKLRYDNKTIKAVSTIHEINQAENLCKTATKVGKVLFDYWCDYKYALTSDTTYIDCKKIKPVNLQVNGQDILNVGFRHGSNIGETLDNLLDDVIAGKVKNHKQTLIEWSKRYMKTLYISDLDGTLLNADAELSQYTLENLNQLIADGLNFTVATARSASTAPTILNGLNLNLPAILMNGVCIYDLKSHSYIHSYKLNKDSCRFLFDTLDEFGLYGFLYSLGSIYYVNADSVHASNFVEERIRKYGKVFTKVDSFTECINDDLIYFSVADSYENLIEVYAKLSVDLELNIEFYQDIYDKDYWYLEICDKNASKYNAVKFLRERYNFDKIIGFGDNMNDLPMFKACDYTCAVANAKAEVKSHADEIIDSNINDGVVNWIIPQSKSLN